MTEKEVWRSVKGWEGWYEVSDQGRVRSLDRVVETKKGPRHRQGSVLRPVRHRRGALYVNLSRNGEMKQARVARLVAEAFVGPVVGARVLHKNGDKADNRPANLRLTPGETKTKLTPDAVAELRQEQRTGAELQHFAEVWGVSLTTVQNAYAGRTWASVSTSPRGGRRKGEDHPRAKLTADDVLEMRRRHVAGETLRKLASVFDVSFGTVRCAVAGHTWKHVPFPSGAAPTPAKAPRPRPRPARSAPIEVDPTRKAAVREIAVRLDKEDLAYLRGKPRSAQELAQFTSMWEMSPEAVRLAYEDAEVWALLQG